MCEFRASLNERADIFYIMLLALIIVPVVMDTLSFIGDEGITQFDDLFSARGTIVVVLMTCCLDLILKSTAGYYSNHIKTSRSFTSGSMKNWSLHPDR